VLKIRPEVAQELERRCGAGFLARLLDRLYRVHPEFVASMDDSAALKWIAAAVRSASSHGFEFEADVMAFVDLTLRLGPSFENQPESAWAREILDNPDLTDPEKIEEIRCKLEPEIESGLPG